MFDESVNMTYPVIADSCPDLPLMVKSNVQTDQNLQVGIGLSYQNFKFVEAADDHGSVMRLNCSVSR